MGHRICAANEHRAYEYYRYSHPFLGMSAEMGKYGHFHLGDLSLRALGTPQNQYLVREHNIKLLFLDHMHLNGLVW